MIDPKKQTSPLSKIPGGFVVEGIFKNPRKRPEQYGRIKVPENYIYVAMARTTGEVLLDMYVIDGYKWHEPIRFPREVIEMTHLVKGTLHITLKKRGKSRVYSYGGFSTKEYKAFIHSDNMLIHYNKVIKPLYK